MLFIISYIDLYVTKLSALRKLQNNELPLLLCLHWFQLGIIHSNTF